MKNLGTSRSDNTGIDIKWISQIEIGFSVLESSKARYSSTILYPGNFNRIKGWILPKMLRVGKIAKIASTERKTCPTNLGLLF